MLPRQASACSYSRLGWIGGRRRAGIRAAHDTLPMGGGRLGPCKGVKSPAATMLVEAAAARTTRQTSLRGGSLFIDWRGDRRPEHGCARSDLRRRKPSRHARQCRTRRVPMTRVWLQVSGSAAGPAAGRFRKPHRPRRFSRTHMSAAAQGFERPKTSVGSQAGWPCVDRRVTQRYPSLTSGKSCQPRCPHDPTGGRGPMSTLPRCGLSMELRGHRFPPRDCPRCLIPAGVTMPMYKSQCAPSRT